MTFKAKLAILGCLLLTACEAPDFELLRSCDNGALILRDKNTNNLWYRYYQNGRRLTPIAKDAILDNICKGT